MKLRHLTLAVAVVPPLFLGGCSSFSKSMNWGDSVWAGKENYREQEAELAEQLEVPPTLVQPEKNNSLVLLNNKQAVLFAEGNLPSQVAELSKQAIPSYQAKGVAVKATLCERWLELQQASADTVWQGIQRYLRTLGFEIKEANRATGIIRTDYVPRKEVVPLVDVSPLTKLFNKWRPEVAEGVMDRFTIHVTVNPETHIAQVRFHHHQVFRVDDGDIETYHVKPYNPVKELEMLYQAAIFFGAHQEAALNQVQISAHMMELVKGQELSGVVLHAPLSQAWTYLQSMIWRADWQVEKVIPERHHMVLNLHQRKEEEKGGFLSSLAFWRHQDNLPKQVILKLAPLKGAREQSLLTVDVPEGVEPLTAEQRKQIFVRLGLLGE